MEVLDLGSHARGHGSGVAGLDLKASPERHLDINPLHQIATTNLSGPGFQGLGIVSLHFLIYEWLLQRSTFEDYFGLVSAAIRNGWQCP